MLSECWSDMLLRLDSPAEWIWHGLLAPRCVTLITADRSAQVNELLHFLVAHRHTGTPFLGRQLRPGKTAVVTSVSRNGWLRRAQQVPLGPNVCFLFDSQARWA